jgi:hypothetical protein
MFIFLLFLLDDRRIRIRISYKWIRMRIREAQKYMDPTDAWLDVTASISFPGEHLGSFLSMQELNIGLRK